MRGLAKGFPFKDTESTAPAKTVIVTRRSEVKSGRRTVMTSHSDPEDFDTDYHTGEPAED